MSPSALHGETCVLAFPTIKGLENPAYVSSGRPHHEACAHHVTNTFNAKRAYIIASASLSKQTDEVKKLQSALGDRLVGTWPGISPHTPWDEVAAATKDAITKQADCLITIGGGSLVDAAKAMLLFMANNITDIPSILSFAKTIPPKLELPLSSEMACIPPTAKLICIPTTLSGGEYTFYTGGTDPTTHQKTLMANPLCGPALIINDPKLTITAPEWVWLSTGVRGIDHCVEAYSRLTPPDTEVDAGATEGFCKIVPNLLATKQNWNDEKARLQCMQGVNAVTIMLKRNALPGASHGIGHQLGPFGVGHGQTSCILLPSVMKYNARANAAQQAKLKDIMWRESIIADVLTKRGLKEDSSDMGDALDALFRELGMPRSLTEVGVGRDKFDAIARNSLTDPCCKHNPIPIEREEQVLEILEMCA